ncbi:hypothetical protein P875_00021319 [Aspergillus parasiticus SU-1]|uniref:Ell binding protein Ebp1 C-terminal domain-containing protein n=3 Tax=Aspergillus subgen. Circumdati TaxID=2720871 RepID=A0A5N6D448_ASPPA|nr:hypothetical protein BDV34DRAFT_207580 [Aspergillus parasiticus]KAE8306476.1 hypothetical protein BDV41DRAFT_569888 [Aspergillus transmontanensis]KJK66550.1 hypothetical protein P875_00021319 [Aspergillus parasiticus SU-1]
MSVNRTSRATDDDIRTTKLPSERAYTSEQHPTDRQLKRLKEDVLPLYPFLLTVPTDVPFRLGSRFVNNWAVGNDGPFAPEEHQLQYMTFLTHHEGDSLLVAVGDWSDGTGNVMSDQQSGLQGAAGTPWSGPVKKKISLNDYKNKRKTGASPSPVGQEASSHHLSMDYVIDDSQGAPKVSPAEKQKSSDKIAASRVSIRAGSEALERKRPAESELENSRLQERKGAEVGFLKKPKLSAEAEAELNKSGRSKANGLPTLLSPTLPPTSSSPKLPRLLSPTLPPNIEKELARLGEETLVSDPSRTKNAPNGDTLRAKSQKAKSFDIGTSCIDSTPVIGRQSLRSKYPNSVADKRPSTTQGSVAPSFSETPTSSLRYQTDDKPSSHEKSAKPQLLMKLKYGRANRKRVEALLKFSGKRKMAPPGSPAKNIADSDSTLIKKPNEIITKATASDNSNPRIYRSEGKAKHVPSSQAPRNAGSEKPRTPVSSTPTAVTHNQEKTKQTSVTPVKDLKDLTYRSETIGNNGRTFSQPTMRYPPGDSATGVKQSLSQVNPQSSASRNGERRAWKDEYQKYGNLGRELKHAAERHTTRDFVADVDEKLAAATAIEAILCFILAFVADDQSKTLSRQISDSSSWLSILAYWRVVKKNSAPFPQLHSLCLILGATSYDAIHALDLERFAVTPLPGENTPVPTPGSDGNTAVSDESKRNRREILELKNRLPECYKESQRLWLEGSQGLSEDILVHEFPDTWSRRSRNFSEQGKQRLKPGDYSGEFFLPLGRMATPVEIVRFGYSILREWCKKEGVEWNGRLCL